MSYVLFLQDSFRQRCHSPAGFGLGAVEWNDQSWAGGSFASAGWTRGGRFLFFPSVPIAGRGQNKEVKPRNTRNTRKNTFPFRVFRVFRGFTLRFPRPAALSSRFRSRNVTPELFCGVSAPASSPRSSFFTIPLPQRHARALWRSFRSGIVTTELFLHDSALASSLKSSLAPIPEPQRRQRAHFRHGKSVFRRFCLGFNVSRRFSAGWNVGRRLADPFGAHGAFASARACNFATDDVSGRISSVTIKPKDSLYGR